ncbi:delta-60 repeat domain-containing protein [Pseudomonas sp. TE3610]
MHSRFTPHHERPTPGASALPQAFDEQMLEIDGDIKAIVQVPGADQWLLAIDSGFEFCVARVNADLTLDRSFGAPGAGYFYDSFDPTGPGLNAVNQISWQDGRILVVGAFFDFDVDRIAIARYHADGTPDLTFNGTGKRIVELPHSPRRPGRLRNGSLHSGISILQAPVVQADGRLLLFFHEVDEQHRDGRSYLVRLLADGTLDREFNQQGFAHVMFEGQEIIAKGVVLQGSNILAYGATQPGSEHNGHGLIARFDHHGHRDTTFNGSGFVVVGDQTNRTELARVVVDVQGAIVAAGTCGSELLVTHRCADGSPAQDFNGGAPLLVGVPFEVDAVKAMTTQQGALLLAVSAGTRGHKGALVRLGRDGLLDPSFADGAGYLMAEQESEYLALSLAEQGEIIAGGYVYRDGYYAWIRRFAADGGGTPASWSRRSR